MWNLWKSISLCIELDYILFHLILFSWICFPYYKIIVCLFYVRPLHKFIAVELNDFRWGSLQTISRFKFTNVYCQGTLIFISHHHYLEKLTTPVELQWLWHLRGSFQALCLHAHFGCILSNHQCLCLYVNKCCANMD